MKFLLFTILALGLRAQNVVTFTPKVIGKGVQLVTLPANSLAYGPQSDGTYIPILVVNGSATPASTPAVAAMINLNDPTGASTGVQMLTFAFYTAYPQYAIWQPVATTTAGANSVASKP